MPHSIIFEASYSQITSIILETARSVYMLRIECFSLDNTYFGIARKRTLEQLALAYVHTLAKILSGLFRALICSKVTLSRLNYDVYIYG